MKKHDKTVLILGAGFAGLATAILLKRNGIHCRVYDAITPNATIGGGICLFANGMNVLRAVGVADKIISTGHVLKTVQFKDEKERTLMEKSVDCSMLYGEPTVLIKRTTALQHLFNQAAELSIPIEFSKKLVSINSLEKSVSVQFEDGSSAIGSILIGADGLNSSVRNFVLQHNIQPTFSQLIYIGGYVHNKDFIDSLKLRPNFHNVSLDPAGVTSYALIEGTSTLFWGTFVKQATRLTRNELNSISDEELLARVKNTHEKSGHTLQSIIAHTDSLIRSNISDIDELPMWSRDRAIIIGDAAHAMNPMLGLGACTSLEDAHLLAGLLTKFPDQHQFVFKHFEHARKKRASEITIAARKSAKLGTISSGLMSQLRNLAIFIMGKVITDRRSNKFYSYKAENDLAKISAES